MVLLLECKQRYSVYIRFHIDAIYLIPTIIASAYEPTASDLMTHYQLAYGS